jgi:hypothetical protein
MITLLILACLALAPAATSPVVVGPGSGRIVLTDVNRDGHADLITQHLLQKRVEVRLGNGRGQFERSSPIAFNFQPGPIALGDLSGDGIQDLAMATRHDDQEYVSILLGNGKGGFGPPTSYRTNNAQKLYKPILYLADLNEDGRLDVVTASGRRNSIEILLGDGRGRFIAAPAVTMESGASLYSFEIGDIDGDGHLDVVSGSDTGSLFVHRGNGKGGFATGTRVGVTVAADPRIAAVADVNDDRRTDVVLAHGRSEIVTVVLNQGGNRFTAQRLRVGQPAWAVTIADVNRDKRSDLIATAVDQNRPFASKIVVLYGNGASFAPAPGSPFPAGPGAYYLASADVDEDGKLDFAASSFESNAVTLLLGR